MAIAETAKLVVDLSLKGNFARQLSQTGRALGKFDARLDQTESRSYRAGQQIGTGIKRAAAIGAVGVGILAVQVEQGLESLVKLEAQTEATNAAIKSTKGVAGITASAVRQMAEEFESVNALFGDEVIQSAENMLLAFTNIRKKAFKPTLQAAIDLSAGMGRGPEGLVAAAKTLGIALNDPTKGLGRLSKAGVTFTAQQTKRIKQLQKEGKLYQAQAIILKEVNKRFGGRGAAFGGETARKVAAFHDAIEDLQRTLAVGLLPVVGNIATALQQLFLDPQIQAGVKQFGEDLGKVLSPANIKSAIASIKGLAETIAPAFGAAAGAIGAVVTAFGKLPPDLRNLLVGAFAVNKITGGLITNILGGLKDLVVGSMNVQAANVTVVGAGGGIPGVGGGKGGGGIGGLIKGGLALTVAGAIVAAAVPIGKAFADALPDSLKGRPGETGMNDPERLLKLARAQQTADATRIINGVTAHLHEEHVRHGDTAIAKSLAASLAAALKRNIATAATQVSAQEIHGRGEHSRAKPPGPSTATSNDIKELAGKLGPLNDTIPQDLNSLVTKTTASITAMQTGSKAITTTDQTQSAITRTRIGSSSSSSAARIVGATQSGSSAIVAAIHSIPPPTVNVTTVNRSNTVIQRYGNGTSRNTPPASYGSGPP